MGRNKFFKSIRWKLVSTYLLLITVLMLITVIFIRDYLIKSKVDEAKNTVLNMSSVLAGQVSSFVSDIENGYTRRYVDEIVKQTSLSYKVRIMIVDPSDTVLVDSYDQYTLSTLRTRETEEALAGQQASNLYRHESDYILYSAVPIVDRSQTVGTCFVSTDANAIFSDIALFMEKLWVIILIAIGVSMLVSVLFADIVSKPIERLTESVKTIAKGRYDVKVRVDGRDEISALGDAFNSMTTKLATVDERRKQFVSNVSHELRTPMTSIKIVSDTLLSEPHWDESVYREFMADIDGEIDRLNNIIDSLLYLVRLEKEDFQMTLTPTRVGTVIERVVKTMGPIANQRRIHLETHMPKSFHMPLDSEKIQQCLLNIIGNAVKYTPEHGRIDVSLFEERDHICILVSDTGIGIPEKDLAYIFDRFYRVDEARARQTGGTGLGLSIAQQIVHAHGGVIDVVSELGKGTDVTIRLPRR